jgi:opacity protein-like surface antigen
MVEAMPLHGLYVKAAGGASVFHNSSLRNSGRRLDPILQVGAGFTLKKGIRADLSFYYTGMPNKAFNTTRTSSTQIDSMDSTIPNLKQHSVILNLHYDLPAKSILTPYFTAGAGWSKTKGRMLTTTTTHTDPICLQPGGGNACPPPEITTDTSTFKSNGLAFNIGFGFTVPLTQMASLECSYKFFVHPKLKSNAPSISRSLKMHTVMVGLTFSM